MYLFLKRGREEREASTPDLTRSSGYRCWADPLVVFTEATGVGVGGTGWYFHRALRNITVCTYFPWSSILLSPLWQCCSEYWFFGCEL